VEGTTGRRKASLSSASSGVRFGSQHWMTRRSPIRGPFVRNTFASQGNPPAQAARLYARLDLTPVPLRPNSKAPYLRSWPTLKPRALLKHFRPDDNLGLRLGRQENGRAIVAIDVDVKNGGNLSTLVQNRSWPRTAEALTPSGGRHHLLTLPAGLVARTRIGLVRGIDLLGQEV
jgi:hypothetical protein